MTEAFLKRFSLTASCYDMALEASRFGEEMQRGLAGEKSSLFMIPTFLSPEAGQIADQTVIVLDAGGTNLRVGRVTFRGGAVADAEFEKCPLPGTERELTCDEFFDAVAEKLAPYLDCGDKIGFCFSYAAQCMENGDAALVAFCKEVKVTGAEGVHICKALKEAIRRRGVKKEFRFVQLNDTVASQLGGMSQSDRSLYGNYIGFILGTGLNACYTEKTGNITKYRGTLYRAPEMIVNMEAGCYAGFAKGEIDRRIDCASAIPGDHQAEKMMSGAYLGKILCEALREAHREGLFASAIPDGVSEIFMPDVNKFLAGDKSMLDTLRMDRSDISLCRAVIEALYGRTARLMASIFTAVALHTAPEKKELCVVLEGSTYQKSPLLQEKLAAELETAEKLSGCRFTVMQAKDPTISGSAYAAVSN
ncbi:MAG: hypothetical protein IJT18_05240 [Oscillospiraceae bacterium]|nr:hypothetical protein [Oscillospiraceae bacterium]